MSRLFRQPHQGLVSYAALTLFALAYLTAMTFVLAPGTFVSHRASVVFAAAPTP
jgi:hypothetical protein